MSKYVSRASAALGNMSNALISVARNNHSLFCSVLLFERKYVANLFKMLFNSVEGIHCAM